MRRRQKEFCLVGLLVGTALPLGATAQTAGAAGATGSNATPTAAPHAPKDGAPSTCEETWTTDRERPKIVQGFPDRGTSGHVAELVLTIEHLMGEQVLPGGLELSDDAPEREILDAADFVLPSTDSEVQPDLERKDSTREEGGVAYAETTITLPLIPLPDEAGRHTLTLPSLPIAIARASGHVQTLCTTPHSIIVEDPLASTADTTPKPDPPPRPQREIWWAARNAVLALLGALPIAVLVVWALARLRKHLRRPAPPPPPRPAWEVALEGLTLLQTEQLLENGEYEAHLDRSVHVLRSYLGARYGFEGLESTTRELLRQLGGRAPDFRFENEVRTLLQRTDLVKFARQLPTHDECQSAMDQVRDIVHKTMPAPRLDPRNQAERSQA